MDEVVLTYFPSSKGKEQAREITKMAVWCNCVTTHLLLLNQFSRKVNERYATAGHSSVVLVSSPTTSNNDIAKARIFETITTVTIQ
jgi:hypothetical protein